MDIIQIRRDTEANWKLKDTLLADGEFAITTDTVPKKLKVGNGVDTWSKIDYFAGLSGTFKVGTVTEGDVASVTNVGTELDVILDFVIPHGTGGGGSTPSVYSIGCMGDSLTQGAQYFKDPNRPPTDAEDIYSWTAYIRKHLNIRVNNYGITSQTTTQMLARFDKDIISNNYSHCIIEGGINDCYFSHPLSTIQANIKEMVKRCRDNKIVPYIVIPYSTWSATYGTPEIHTAIDTFRTWLLQYVKDENIVWINWFHLFNNAINDSFLTTLFGTDCLHPNVDGYIRIGVETIKVLHKVFTPLKGCFSTHEDMIGFYKAGEVPTDTYSAGTLIYNSAPVEDAWGSVISTGTPKEFLSGGIKLRSRFSLPVNSCSSIKYTDKTPRYFQKGDTVLVDDEVGKQLKVMEVDTSGWTAWTEDVPKLTWSQKAIVPYGGGGTPIVFPWATPTLLNNWQHYGAPFDGVQYCKTADGVVRLQGIIAGGVVNAQGDVPAFILPVGFRPYRDLLFPTLNSTTLGCAWVKPTGEVCVTQGVTNAISLNNISFLVKGSVG